MSTAKTYYIERPLTGELADPGSPVRQFLDSRFSRGLREVQRRFRQPAPPLAVPGVLPTEANSGTIGTAADWLLRFVIDPEPDLELAAYGAALCADNGILISRRAIDQALGPLGVSMPQRPSAEVRTFVGPRAGTTCQADALYRACWLLALLTEAFRRGPARVTIGPLVRFLGRPASAAELLGLAPPAAIRQLADFRDVYRTALLPALADRHGTWTIGPTFTGSQIMSADADLIAAGLLLDLKTTSKKPSLSVNDLFQIIGYALLDYDDEFGLNSVGIFSARYRYLVTWELGALLDELAGHETSLATVRGQFRDLLIRHAAPARRR